MLHPSVSVSVMLSSRVYLLSLAALFAPTALVTAVLCQLAGPASSRRQLHLPAADSQNKQHCNLGGVLSGSPGVASSSLC